MITKVLLCFLEEADVCIRMVLGPSGDSVFRVRVRTCCLRCGLGESVGLRCVRTRESERGVAAPRSDPLGSIIVEILRVSKAGM